MISMKIMQQLSADHHHHHHQTIDDALIFEVNKNCGNYLKIESLLKIHEEILVKEYIVNEGKEERK